MRGSKYDFLPEGAVKLLLIGRAPNGWEFTPTDTETPPLIYTEESFSQEAQKQFSDSRGFSSWIEIRSNGTLYDKRSNYCVSRSPFWNYSKGILEKLNGNPSLEPKWMENIAWSNLYKIAPEDGGNPDEDLKKEQGSICEEILVAEIEELHPTHILLLTGYKWFKPFEDCFSDVHPVEKNINGGKNKIFVEGTARSKCGNAKVVIACRPEWRKKDPYVEAVVKAFNEL